jgi:hypothetical protein
LRRRSAIAGLLAAALALVAPVGAPRSNEIPGHGLAVIDRFVGEWETDVRIRHDGPPVRILATRGRAIGVRSLGDRYVEFRSTSIPAGQSDLQIMTYDDASGRYRQWLFDSDGYRHEAEGQWDAATSILRWRGGHGAVTFVIDDHWVAPDRLEWTLVRTGPDGRRVQTIRGVLTRIR